MRGDFLRPACGLILCLMFIQSAFSKTLNVPSASYPSIQCAIDASLPGDEVIVAPGRYLENIRIQGKNITLRSSSPTNANTVMATIIDGRSSASVVVFAGTEGSSCVLSGFTITGGRANVGGAVNGNGTFATISRNRFTTNTATGAQGNGGGIANCDGVIDRNTVIANRSNNMGGGLYGCDGKITFNNISSNRGPLGGGISVCNAVIADNSVQDNISLFGQGGGIYASNGTFERNIVRKNSARYGGGFFGCQGNIRSNIISRNIAGEVGGGVLSFSGIIEKNTITSNTATFWGGGIADASGSIKNNILTYNRGGDAGGAIYQSSANIENNTIYGNMTSNAPPPTGGGGGLSNCFGSISNNIIWANQSPIDSQLSSTSLPSYSCIQNWNAGGTGNINIDPRLANPSTGNFHLQSSSPCIDAGRRVNSVTEDFEGDTRPFIFASLNRGDGSGYDIGADELILKNSQASFWTLY